ncbi:MAG: transaldolase [Solirubrobacterales bacterium]
MNPNEELQDLGQSIWVDAITRRMLDDGTLQRYIDELAVTGLTSNPTIFEKAIDGSDDYDDQISELLGRGKSGEELFFELAIDDLRRAADLFADVHQRTDGVDGYVSLEVSPLLAYETQETTSEAARLHRQAERENLLIKIPGTMEGGGAITETIAAGIPVNVTLLFDHSQYEAQADAYMSGIERRIEAGEDPRVASVASVFVSRWDVAAKEQVGGDLHGKLGIAAAAKAYKSYRELLASDRWANLEAEGARPQRLLFASTSAKDPAMRDTAYVEALAAPDTVDTMPDSTVEAFADHGEVGAPLPDDGGDCEQVLASFEEAGVDIDALASRLQSEGAEKFNDSWRELLAGIERASEQVAAE